MSDGLSTRRNEHAAALRVRRGWSILSAWRSGFDETFPDGVAGYLGPACFARRAGGQPEVASLGIARSGTGRVVLASRRGRAAVGSARSPLHLRSRRLLRVLGASCVTCGLSDAKRGPSADAAAAGVGRIGQGIRFENLLRRAAPYLER